MTDQAIFLCGTFISAIFAAAIYTMARVKFNSLEYKENNMTPMKNKDPEFQTAPIPIQRNAQNQNLNH